MLGRFRQAAPPISARTQIPCLEVALCSSYSSHLTLIRTTSELRTPSNLPQATCAFTRTQSSRCNDLSLSPLKLHQKSSPRNHTHPNEDCPRSNELRPHLKQGLTCIQLVGEDPTHRSTRTLSCILLYICAGFSPTSTADEHSCSLLPK